MQDQFWICIWKLSLKHLSLRGCRGDCESLMSMGVSRTEVNVDLVWNDVQEFQLRGGGQRPATKFPTLLTSVRAVNSKSFIMQSNG